MEFFLQNDNLDALHQLLHTSSEFEKVLHPSARKYVQDSTAIARTPVDVKENATSYVFIADMPGLTSSDIQVQVENEKTLSISGKRKREEKPEDEDGKYIRMERRPAKFMRKFTLPGDANTDKISASCKDGILTVTVQKVAPEPEKPKVIEIPVS